MAPATAAFLYPAVAVSSRALPLRRVRHLAVRAVASLPASKPVPASSKTGKWQWRFENKPLNIYYEEHEQETSENVKNILMIPTISDVSTVEEWRVIAKDIVGRKGELGYRATIVDWPGLGYSDRPSLNYNADVMQSFLVQLMNSSNSPVANADGELVIVGGGHAATIAVRAAGMGLIKPPAIAALHLPGLDYPLYLAEVLIWKPGMDHWLDDVQCSGEQRKVHPVSVQVPCLCQP